MTRFLFVTLSLAVLFSLNASAECRLDPAWKVSDDFRPDGARTASVAALTSSGGAVFAAGGADRRIWLVRRSIDRGASWETVDSGPGTGDAVATAAAAAPQPSHIVYVAGSSAGAGSGRLWVLRKSSDRGATWSTVSTWASDATYRLEGDPAALAVTGNGSVYLVGSMSDGVTSRWITLRSRDGGVHFEKVDEFQRSSGETTQGLSIVAAPWDGIFAVGASGTGAASHWLVRYSPDGDSWRTVDDLAGARAASIALAYDGTAAVVGTQVAGDGSVHELTRRGSLRDPVFWNTIDDFVTDAPAGAGSAAMPVAVAFGAEGELIVAGPGEVRRAQSAFAGRFEQLRSMPGQSAGASTTSDSGDVYLGGSFGQAWGVSVLGCSVQGGPLEALIQPASASIR